MTAGIWFWILFVISLLFTGWSSWPFNQAHAPYGLIYILIGLLGWGIFGAPIR